MSDGFDAKCIAELDHVIAELLKALPKETKAFMRKQAILARNHAKKIARSKVKRRTGNYLKGIAAGKKVYEWSDAEYNVRAYNKAPHGHLIDVGHVQVGHRPGFKRGAFIRGYGIMDEANESFAEEFARNVEDDLGDFIVKELEK